MPRRTMQVHGAAMAAGTAPPPITFARLRALAIVEHIFGAIFIGFQSTPHLPRIWASMPQQERSHAPEYAHWIGLIGRDILPLALTDLSILHSPSGHQQHFLGAHNAPYFLSFDHTFFSWQRLPLRPQLPCLTAPSLIYAPPRT